MGRHAAGESFLRGFLRHADVDAFHFFNASNQASAALNPLINRIEPPTKSVIWSTRRQRQNLARPGCLYVPGPTLAAEAWARRPFGARQFSLCGVTHTTATHRVMDAVADLSVAPLEPWDALICTSTAVRASVEAELSAVREDLTQRLGATRLPQPQLATIPLGLNSADFAPDPAQRRSWREKLDIPEDALVVLYLGRYSAGAKMNPALMAMALEAAAQRTGRQIYWVVAGWAGTDQESAKFHAMTKQWCPSIHYRGVDGRPPDTRFSIWSVADIFLSLSENIQETFGLTPLEAMAAGLPCVISDWNGYRDTVRHGIDGFRIPTIAPRAGLGRDLAFGYANDWYSYDQYVAAASQLSAVDLRLAADALVALIGDPELRRKQGECGARRARETFDWARIIPQYQALWGELAAVRATVGAANAPASLTDNPRRMDPFRLFAAYPTQVLQPDTMIEAVPDLTWPDVQARLALPLAALANWAMPTMDEIEHVFNQLARSSPMAASEVIVALPPSRQPFVERGILWLAKFGIVRIATRIIMSE